MSVRIYVDTNVYLDYLEGRRDNIRPLGEFAYQIFRRAIGCEFEIVICDLVIDELIRQKTSGQSLEDLLARLELANKLVRVEVRDEDDAIAKKSGNYSDTLHALTAKMSGCRFIVTRNIDDFLCLSDLVEPKLPEEL